MGGGASKSAKKNTHQHVIECQPYCKEEDNRQNNTPDRNSKQNILSRTSTSPRGRIESERSNQASTPSAQHHEQNTDDYECQKRSIRDGQDDEEDDCYSQHSCEYQEGDDLDDNNEEEETAEAAHLRMLFAQSAMSMDMDNEDLIFNLLYFGGDTASFATMMNNAAEETVAAHSAGNTPYKLAPASETALKKLTVVCITEDILRELHLQECSICQEDMEVGGQAAIMPGCGHCFHDDCVLKWFTLQSWCPVCRTKILPGGENEDALSSEDQKPAGKNGPSSDEAAHLGGLKSAAVVESAVQDQSEDRMEDVD